MNELLPSQKNEVLLAIRESGMNPLEFEFTESRRPRSTVTSIQLTHVPSKYWFRLHGTIVRFSPGEETSQEQSNELSWTGKIGKLRLWLGYLKREVEAPDLWASLARERELLGVEPAGAVNTPFSAEEQIQAKRAIEEIRIYISSTYSLADEPLAEVNRKLDYLIDASSRLGRIDWKNIVIGALVTLALERVLRSGSGMSDLFGFAGHLLRQLLGGVISPPLLH